MSGCVRRGSEGAAKAVADTATEIGSLRASVANSEIGVDSLRATTGEIRQQIERIE